MSTQLVFIMLFVWVVVVPLVVLSVGLRISSLRERGRWPSGERAEVARFSRRGGAGLRGPGSRTPHWSVQGR